MSFSFRFVLEKQEKYLRALAEMENVRERSRKDVENARHFGIQKFSKDVRCFSSNAAGVYAEKLFYLCTPAA